MRIKYGMPFEEAHRKATIAHNWSKAVKDHLIISSIITISFLILS